jgi:GGDEF domain-containing protein
MIDIDHFKGFNDKYGHDAGDFVLSAVARALRRRFAPPIWRVATVGRNSPLCCRKQASNVPASVPCRCGSRFGTPSGQSLPAPTASFGVAVFPANGTKSTDLLKAADEALYRAKHEGRDRISVAIEGQPVT